MRIRSIEKDKQFGQHFRTRERDTYIGKIQAGKMGFFRRILI